MTLTEAARLTKVGSLLAVLLLMLSLILPSTLAKVKRTLFPPKTPPPEVAFGQLPAIEIPNLPIKEGVSPKYILDTKTGRLPKNLPDRLKVYQITLPPPSPLVGERAQEQAAKLGFKGEPQRLSSREFLWKKEDEGRELKIDITTGNFTLKTEIARLTKLDKGSTPSKAAAIEQAKNFLASLGGLTNDYVEGRKEAAYLKVNGDDLRKVESLSEAQLTRVDFFREVGKQPVLTPKPYEGLINVILSQNGIVAINYYAWPLDPTQGSTYPLKNPETMWSQVENGQARIVFLGPLKGDPYRSYTPRSPRNIFIREIYLAYFDSDKYQAYLQPVFVLEGLAVTPEKKQLKFIAYLPAISDRWLKETSPN